MARSRDENTRETQSTANRPKRGDGTQMEQRESVQPNWHGASQRPQEEFINEVDARPNAPQPSSARKMSGDQAPDAKTPDEVFPTGGPEAQSDG